MVNDTFRDASRDEELRIAGLDVMKCNQLQLKSHGGSFYTSSMKSGEFLALYDFCYFIFSAALFSAIGDDLGPSVRDSLTYLHNSAGN